MEFGPEKWDERFRCGAMPYGTEPSLFLKEQGHRLRRGQVALVPGDGGGRNGVWLAEQGLDVTCLDFSPEGLAAAREHARRRGVSVREVLADVAGWQWPIYAYNCIAMVYLHMDPAYRRAVHRAALRALKPGGFLLIEGFHVDQMAFSSGGPRDPALLFTEDILREDLAASEWIEIRTERVILDESDLHRGPGVLVRLICGR